MQPKLALAFLFQGLLFTPIGLSAAQTSPTADTNAKSVAASVSVKAQAGEWVEALILLDDNVESSIQAVAESAKPPPYRMQRADYEAHIQHKTQLLDSLKYQARQTLSGSDLEELSQYPAFPIMHVRINSSKALDRLTKHPKVKSIDEVGQRQRMLAQSLPLIQQPSVQSAGHTGAGTTVCVLDTGTDYTRTAFGSCVEPGGACKVAYAQDFTPSDDGFRDDNATGIGETNGHGTNVSGIVLGVAPGAKVAALDVFRADGFAYDPDIISAINWCVTNKADYNIASINMSLGGDRFFEPLPTSDSWGTSIQSAIDAGIMVVAASGNDAYSDSMGVPAAYEGVVSVGAVYDSNLGGISWSACTDPTTQVDQITCFSNSASFLTLLAPGSSISAAGISMSGTSQATPHVAGADAVLKAIYPADSVAQRLARLQQSPAPIITDPRNNVATRRIDLLAAIGTPPSQGTIGFTASKSSFSESAGNATLTVSRTGGNSGAVGISYSTANDTATADSDYTSAVGNLSWAGGEIGDKSIIIPIVADATFEPNETFTVNLSGASGGAALGISTNTVTIVNDDEDGFPSGGTLPVGWTQPVGSAAPWVVALDSSYAGTNSLKSGVIGNSQKSGITYTGSFDTGTVSFARRVSSEASWDFLRFYIDGIQQGQWSGEVAWGVVSFPISAGTHTLLWQYEKDGSVSSGNDAAWIDSVSLSMPTDGVCGSANNILTPTMPTGTSLCTIGIASGVTTSATNYSWSCGGIYGGNTNSCSAPRGYVVTATAGANGSVSPVSQLIAHGNWATLTVTPNEDFKASGTGCAGALTSLTTYTTSQIAADCAVTVTFSVIDDQFPSGSTPPSGYTNPTDSNAAWTVDSSTAFAGPSSMKSGTVGHNQRSDLQYRGHLTAGAIIFYVRTSSQTGGDYLEFHVDGVKMQSWSGETPWTKVSVPIPAGDHTLLWRYVKNSSVTSGSDAAWIDAVRLPLVVADLSWILLLLD